jgi:hypothetical protein
VTASLAPQRLRDVPHSFPDTLRQKYHTPGRGWFPIGVRIRLWVRQTPASPSWPSPQPPYPRSVAPFSRLVPAGMAGSSPIGIRISAWGREKFPVRRESVRVMARMPMTAFLAQEAWSARLHCPGWLEGAGAAGSGRQQVQFDRAYAEDVPRCGSPGMGGAGRGWRPHTTQPTAGPADRRATAARLKSKPCA